MVAATASPDLILQADETGLAEPGPSPGHEPAGRKVLGGGSRPNLVVLGAGQAMLGWSILPGRSGHSWRAG